MGSCPAISPVKTGDIFWDKNRPTITKTPLECISVPSPADIAKDSERAFLGTHAWITFRLDLLGIDWRLWEQLGEARSKCRHLARVPLPPDVARDLAALYLAKGAHATTAIEGNTLTEDQALDAVRGQLELPVGQEYLGVEIQNVLDACGELDRRIYAAEGRFELSFDELCELNSAVLRGLEKEDHVEPGHIRRAPVAVGGVYRGAPWEDCDFLLRVLCDWLNSEDFAPVDDPRETFLRAFLRAAIAHLYIAWIHPFGDGNGRTARLVEFGILTSAGVPFVAAQLLSNHYNATRGAYYRQLDYARKSGGDVRRFLAYAIEGFVGQLDQQLQQVHAVNFRAAWTNHVHEVFAGESTPAPRRQRDLVLALPSDRWVPRSRITTFSPELAAAYAGKGAKTVTRDINALLLRGLIERGPEGIRARTAIMLGLLPPVAGGSAI